MEITLQYFECCPNWRLAEDRLRQTLAALGRADQAIRHERVESPEEAERVGFRGSPTILVEGVDPFGQPDDPTGLACRIYRTASGPQAAPTIEQLQRALTR